MDDALTFLWLLVADISPDAIRQEDQIRCILLPVSSKIPSPERGENRLYASLSHPYIWSLMVFRVRLRAQAVSSAGKKQVVSRRSRMRVTGS